MKYLDCQSVAAAIESTAAICGRPVDDVRAAIAAYEPDWDTRDEDPARVGPREMLRTLGIELTSLRWDGTYYFHGTRVLDPSSFTQDGILPLGKVIERLWVDLYGLMRGEITEGEWRSLRAKLEKGGGGHSGWLYRLKLGDQKLHGPYSILTRDHHLQASECTHDYLRIPEIVEDITRVVGNGLQERFEKAAQSCIVKFRADYADTHALEAACWYIYSMIHEGVPGWHGLHCGDGAGQVVPPDNIISVEITRHGGKLG